MCLVTLTHTLFTCKQVKARRHLRGYCSKSLPGCEKKKTRGMRHKFAHFVSPLQDFSAYSQPPGTPSAQISSSPAPPWTSLLLPALSEVTVKLVRSKTLLCRHDSSLCLAAPSTMPSCGSLTLSLKS